MKIALVGNQNCGKTTLFNTLTGSNQHVGNFPGVTVDSKKGIIKKHNDWEIWDLPGIYSLSPYSQEEIVTRNFLIKEDPDAIINIVDVTNIERNLYLTLQLMSLNKPMVIALNMMDEMLGSGNNVDVEKLTEGLGVRCIPIVASKGDGIDELLSTLNKVCNDFEFPKITDVCRDGSPIHRAIHAMMLQIEDHAKLYKIPLRYAANNLLEGDNLIKEDLHLSNNEKEIVEHMIKEMTDETGFDKEISFAMMRYEFIDSVCEKAVFRKNEQTKEQIRSNKIDKVLTHKVFAFPIFIVLIGLIFYLTFDLIGGNLQSLLENLISKGINSLSTTMINNGFSKVATSLLCNGVLTGIGSVLTFLPIVILLFFFLSLLEDSGYMARIAFIMDKPLRKIGLSGRSFVPMLIGFGCSVPAVMSTRTLTGDKDKKATLLLIPFMPCTAKLPIFTVLCAAFFKVKSIWIIMLLYLISVLLGVLVAFIFHLIKKSKSSPFMMELPAYRIPTFKNTILLMWEKAKDFLKKAFTIIFIASLVVWFLSSFDYKFNFVGENMENSLLSTIAKFITPVFYPIGVRDWQVTSAILSGLSAKEAVVSTLEILNFNLASLSVGQGISLMLFLLLYMPCVATFSVLIKEVKSFWKGALYMLFQTAFAFLIATCFFQIWSLF